MTRQSQLGRVRKRRCQRTSSITHFSTRRCSKTQCMVMLARTSSMREVQYHPAPWRCSEIPGRGFAKILLRQPHAIAQCTVFHAQLTITYDDSCFSCN